MKRNLTVVLIIVAGTLAFYLPGGFCENATANPSGEGEQNLLKMVLKGEDGAIKILCPAYFEILRSRGICHEIDKAGGRFPWFKIKLGDQLE